MAEQPPCVLVVDDDPEIRKLATGYLQAEGYRTVDTGSPRKVPQLLRHNDVALILLDIVMPEQDGLELAAEIRARSKHRATPIIMVTAKGEQADVVSAIKAGANDYVVKPFTKEALVTKVKKHLKP